MGLTEDNLVSRLRPDSAESRDFLCLLFVWSSFVTRMDRVEGVIYHSIRLVTALAPLFPTPCYTTCGSNEELQFRWVPSHAGTAGNEKTDEWAKVAARNERGSEQLPYEFSSTSLAHLKRGIAERKWVEACS